MIGFGGLSRPIAAVAVLAAMILGGDATAATPAGPVAAVALPRLPAPLGLSFGMRPEEVPLPVVVPPPPLAVVTPPRAPVNAPAPRSTSYRPAAAPTALFSSAAPVTGANTPAPPPPRPVSEVLRRQASQDGLGDYLRACEAAFDSVSALAAFDQMWLAWRAQHLRGGEGSDFADDLPDRAGVGVAPASSLAREAAGWRSAGLYRFDGADGRRVVCLLFTADGLAQVFLAGHALEGLRDDVVSRLENQPRLEGFGLTREARRFSLSLRRPACGLYCRLFGERMLVERRLWLDPRARVLVAAKRGVVVSGFTGLFAGGEQSEVSDGITDSFLASIDLGRRAFVPRRPWVAGWASRLGTSQAAPAFAPPPVGTSRKALVESFVP